MTGQFGDLRMLQKESADSEQNPRTESSWARVLLFVTISLAMVGAFWLSRMYFSGQNRPGKSLPSASQALLLHDKERKQNVDLMILLEQLSSNDDDIRESGKKRIIELAQQSDENRNIVVAELLKRVSMPGFKYDLVTSSGSYFWVSVSEIFGRLKVVEAIDFLIDCLDCTATTQYASDSYRHKPAVRALLGMGQPAIPKLSETLYHPNPQVRIYAGICLGNIRGDAARSALSDATSGEQDINVLKSIKNSIDAIDREKARLRELAKVSS